MLAANAAAPGKKPRRIRTQTKAFLALYVQAVHELRPVEIPPRFDRTDEKNKTGAQQLMAWLDGHLVRDSKKISRRRWIQELL